jgi:hypothetical protein
VRFLPMVATAEVKTVLPQANPHGAPGTEQGLAGHRAVVSTHQMPDPAPKGAS